LAGLGQAVFGGFTFCGSLWLASAGVYEKSPRHGDGQQPLFWRHAARAKNTARLRQLRSPAFGRQVKRISRETERVFTSGSGRNFIGEFEGVSFADFPKLGKAQLGIASVIRRYTRRNGSCVPQGLHGVRPEAPSGQPDVQGIERLVTGILQAIF